MRNLMKGVLLISWCSASFGQGPGRDPASLLDRLEGQWLLRGNIAGKPTIHDVEAHWILHHEYLEIHEVSREKDTQGGPAYEAKLLVSWDQQTKQYACLWLDSTAGGALTSQVTCRGNPSASSIPFVFTISPADSIHTTFAYRENSDTWQWLIDNVTDGKTSRFADVELSRANSVAIGSRPAHTNVPTPQKRP